MQDNRAVHVLNSLIETTLDSAHGYRDAADGASDPQLKSLFSERANRREELAQRLQAEVRSFGAEPERDQSALGKAHNVFAEIRGKLMGRDDSGVVSEVERGEDFIKGKFEEASRDQDLPGHVRALIATEFGTIKAEHDEVSRLKHQMH